MTQNYTTYATIELSIASEQPIDFPPANIGTNNGLSDIDIWYSTCTNTTITPNTKGKL